MRPLLNTVRWSCCHGSLVVSPFPQPAIKERFVHFCSLSLYIDDRTSKTTAAENGKKKNRLCEGVVQVKYEWLMFLSFVQNFVCEFKVELNANVLKL